MMRYSYQESPLGPILIAGDDRGLRKISFQSEKEAQQPAAGWVEDPGAFRNARHQLAAYFEGWLREFDLELAPQGTPFQQCVYGELRRVTYGEVISYGELARRIGKPKAARAVGAANGANPLPIVIPCHRVIGSNGELTGYGGGIQIKRALLSLERSQLSFW